MYSLDFRKTWKHYTTLFFKSGQQQIQLTTKNSDDYGLHCISRYLLLY